MLQDSVATPQEVIVKDTIFIPTYLEKNPMYVGDDTSMNISCKQYIVNILKDSFPQPKQAHTLFLDRTPLKHNNLQLEPKQNNYNANWIFVVFIVVAFITALEFRFSRALSGEFLSGCFYKTPLNLSTKDGERVHSLTFLPIFFIFLPLLALLLYGICNYFEYLSVFEQYKIKGIFIFLALYIILTISYLAKIVFIKFFGWVFRSKKIANYYVQMHLNFNFLLALTLIIPVFCAFYVDAFYQEIFLFGSLILIGLEIFMRIIKTFTTIIASSKFSHLYLFFYLCTIELLPLIVLGKLLLF